MKDEKVIQNHGGSTSVPDKPSSPAPVKWRVGSKVRLNVYHGDRPVCQCHDEFDAQRIVTAMNMLEEMSRGTPLGGGAVLVGIPSKNQALLAFFVSYCYQHPEYRFWQALRNWADLPFLLAGTKPAHEGGGDLYDTFYWEENVNVRSLAKARGEA